jgi:hypothetical protein
MGEGKASLENFIAYIQYLQEHVGAAFASGRSLDEIQEYVPLPALLHIPTMIPATPEFQALFSDLHRLNVLATYRALEEASTTSNRSER